MRESTARKEHRAKCKNRHGEQCLAASGYSLGLVF